jgi:hypothetical protein
MTALPFLPMAETCVQVSGLLLAERSDFGADRPYNSRSLE